MVPAEIYQTLPRVSSRKFARTILLLLESNIISDAFSRDDTSENFAWSSYYRPEFEQVLCELRKFSSAEDQASYIERRCRDACDRVKVGAICFDVFHVADASVTVGSCAIPVGAGAEIEQGKETFYAA
jgi:hypothetical protein